MTNSVNGREIVLEILLEVTEKGQFSHIVLRDTLGKYQYLDKRDRAFITRTVDGTLEHMIEIDYILDQFSKVKVRKMKPVIRAILRSAVYQLKYMDSIPDRAVCSEAVKLASRKGLSGLKGYVNGVLRNIARDADRVRYPDDRMEELSIRYSCPAWILELWSRTYDTDLIEKMLADFQREKPLTIRCCLNKTTPGQLQTELERDGVSVEQHPYLPYAFCISGFDHLDELDAFRKGLFTVQDISSMLVSEIAGPHAGAKVIDVCAAPGGKALHMAEKLLIAGQGNGHVEARDLTETKTDMIRENIRRLGLDNVSAVCMDASVPDQASAGTADIVIADLPCSGLGVIGKKPDLRYRSSPEGTESLIRLQRQILSCVQEYVKPGGVLMYSTCTVNPGENEENVKWFLQHYPDFEAVDFSEMLCTELRDSVDAAGWMQLLPGIHRSDGFFIAKMKRKKR